jgi:hypothetical protein
MRNQDVRVRKAIQRAIDVKSSRKPPMAEPRLWPWHRALGVAATAGQYSTIRIGPALLAEAGVTDLT